MGKSYDLFFFQSYKIEWKAYITVLKTQSRVELTSQKSIALEPTTIEYIP